jgi:hypothetical protein
MNSQLSLREAYIQRKTKEQERNLHEVKTLVESSALIVEKLDTATISRIVDSMNGVEEALSSVIGKLPSLKAGLDKAEDELVGLVSGKAGNNPKKTGKMLVKALSFYQNLTAFLRQDLPVLLKSRILAPAKATPDQPVGPRIAPAFLQALKINWGNRQGGFFKKLFAGSDIPYIDNNSLAQELSNLSFKELEALTKVGQTPGVLTQAQVNQVAAQVVNPPSTPSSPSPGNPPQTSSREQEDLDTVKEFLDMFGGAGGLITFLQRNGLDKADSATVAKAFKAVIDNKKK